MKRFWKGDTIWNWIELIINILLWILIFRLLYTLEVAKMSDKPNRVVIVTGLSDAYITEVRAERPEDVVVMIYSLDTLEGTAYESKDIEPLGVVQENALPCPP